MNEQELNVSVRTKSDAERIADLVVSLVGLGILAYTLNPTPFDHAVEWLRVRVERMQHRISIWDTLNSIRTLPETER